MLATLSVAIFRRARFSVPLWFNPDFKMKFKSAVPVISTAEVRATVDYYSRVLGFREHFIFGDPPVYAGVERDGVLLYITHDPKMVATLQSAKLHPDVFLWVEDVDEWFEEHRRRGAKVIEEASNRPWDARQYVLEDPNGYRLKIAQPLDQVE
jgi:uncharacterized glyoxalase superfamily protein PhnB